MTPQAEPVLVLPLASGQRRFSQSRGLDIAIGESEAALP